MTFSEKRGANVYDRHSERQAWKGGGNCSSVHHGEKTKTVSHLVGVLADL